MFGTEDEQLNMVLLPAQLLLIEAELQVLLKAFLRNNLPEQRRVGYNQSFQPAPEQQYADEWTWSVTTPVVEDGMEFYV